MIKINKTYTVFKNTNKEFTGNLLEIEKFYKISYNRLLWEINNSFNNNNNSDCNGNNNNNNLNLDNIIYNIARYKTAFDNVENKNKFIGTYLEIADNFNINYSTMISLIKYKNMTLDESINYLVEKEKNKMNKIEQIYTIFKNNKNNYSNIYYFL